MSAHLVDTTLFFSPTSGGVRRYLLAKQNWLTDHPWLRHTLLVPGPRSEGRAGGTVTVASPRVPGAGGYRCPVRPFAWRRRLEALEPDLIEFGDPYHPGWLALEAGHRLGVPVVGFYHSDLPSVLGSRLGRAVRAPGEAYVAALYQRADLVLAPSAVMTDALHALGVPGARWQPLGVDTDLFHPSRRDPRLRERLGLARSTRLLVFAGRFSRDKQLRVLEAAAQRLGAPYHLLLVGGQRLERRSERITVCPYQRDQRALATLLASADLLVHAGDRETFGLIAIEALACGTPVVAANAAALPELVDETVGALATPGDPGSFAEAIDGVWARSRETLSAAARRRAEERYAWRRVFSSLLRQYARLSRHVAVATSGEGAVV